MAKDEPLTKTVETCIQRFGKQFSRWSDNRVWYEYDAQFRLLIHLCSSLDPSSPKQAAMVHAEIPARNGQRYDIAVYDKETAQRIVDRHFANPEWADIMREKERVAVVVEVALAWVEGEPKTRMSHHSIYYAYRTRIRAAMRRLVDNAEDGQLKRGTTHYVVICCVTRQYKRTRKYADYELVEKAREWVKKELRRNCANKPIFVRVYWASDHPDDSPDWI